MSVIVLTKNEEAGISACLSHLADFDQVIVVDSNSNDRTVELATAAGAEVIQFVWDGQYPKKKQWSLQHPSVRHDWVLLLDADEYPSSDLIRELRDESASPTHSNVAFDIQLTYKFAGRFLEHGHRVTKRSLLNRTQTEFPVVDDLHAPGIREVEGHYQPVAHGAIGRLRGTIFHDDQDPVRSWFDRHNRYSDWEAYLAMHRETKKDIASKRTTKGRIFDALPLKPALFFLYSVVARLGFLDGRAGIDYALALSSYYWQIGVKIRELERADSSDRIG